MGAFTGIRSVRRFTATLTDSASTSEVIEIGDGGNARIYLPGAVVGTGDITSTSAAIWDLDPSTGDYVAASDSDSTALTVTLTAGSTAESVNLPTDIFAADKIRLVLNAAESILVGVVVKS